MSDRYTELPYTTTDAFQTYSTYTDLPSGGIEGAVAYVTDTDTTYTFDGTTWHALGMGTGDASGPASSTDNAIARFDGTGGKTLQNSVVTIADSTGNMAGVGTVSAGAITSSSLTASKAVVSDGSKVLTSSATTATEIGYVAGVTSAIQTQISAKVTGPSSATDNALVRFDGTTGKLVQNGAVTVVDNGGLVVDVTYPDAALTLKNAGGASWSLLNYAGVSLDFYTGGARFQIQDDQPGTNSTILYGRSGTNLVLSTDGGSASANVKVKGSSGQTADLLVLQTNTPTNMFAVTVAGATSMASTLRVGGVGTATTSAAVDINSTTGALLLPRMTTAQRDLLTAANGMLVYNTTTDKVNAYVAGGWVALVTL